MSSEGVRPSRGGGEGMHSEEEGWTPAYRGMICGWRHCMPSLATHISHDAGVPLQTVNTVKFMFETNSQHSPEGCCEGRGLYNSTQVCNIVHVSMCGK